MSVYFDASVIVSMVIRDALAQRADAYLLKESPRAVVSDLATNEVIAAVGIRLRRRELDLRGAQAALSALDAWRAAMAQRCVTTPGDLAVAETFLRRFDLALRAPDAIHLAIAQRLHLAIATFDVRMSSAARAVGLEIAPA